MGGPQAKTLAVRLAQGPSPVTTLQAACSRVPEPTLYTRAPAPNTWEQGLQVSLGQDLASPRPGQGTRRGSWEGAPAGRRVAPAPAVGVGMTWVIICRENRSFCRSLAGQVSSHGASGRASVCERGALRTRSV